MGTQRSGLVLFAIGIAVMVADIVYGRQIQNEVAALPVRPLRGLTR